jgi:hypothetical protein
MLPPSDPGWTDVRPPGVSRPPPVPPDDVYPIGTDRTVTPCRDRPLRTPKMAKVELFGNPLNRSAQYGWPNMRKGPSCVG